MTRIGLISDTHSYLDERVFMHFAQCDDAPHCPGNARHRNGHHIGRRAFIPGAWRAAPDARMGHHAGRRTQQLVQRSAPVVHPRRCDHAHRAGVQSAG